MPNDTRDSPSPETATTESSGTAQRLLSLDVFRGLTILGMILVNNPGSWAEGSRYWPLDHAAWHGWTPTDLVFPFFLFIVGTSLAYSLRKYRDGQRINPAVYGRIVRRTIVLLLLGLGLGLAYRLCTLAFGQTSTMNLDTLRIPGVLQRIALVYVAASLIALHIPLRGQTVLAAVLLFGYWAVLAWLPNPRDYQANLSREGNVARVVDRAVIGEEHLYTQGQREPTDPEGLLSTLPAIATALLGYWTGLVIQRRGANSHTVGVLIAAGVACTVIGLGWGTVFPINKKIWTSSYVLLTAGLAMIVLAGCLLKFDLWGWRRLARPFEIVGINAIFVFVASGLLATVLGTAEIGKTSAKGWFYQRAFTSWIGEPRLASLAYAAATVAFWWLILWGMSRRGWSVRV